MLDSDVKLFPIRGGQPYTCRAYTQDRRYNFPFFHVKDDPANEAGVPVIIFTSIYDSNQRQPIDFLFTLPREHNFIVTIMNMRTRKLRVSFVSS
jgi:hypothetical protein